MTIARDNMLVGDLFGRAPWADQPRTSSSEARKAAQDSRYLKNIVAADELQAALKDGKWHQVMVAEEIANRHGIKNITPLVDRAGVCLDGGRVILSKAAVV